MHDAADVVIQDNVHVDMHSAAPPTLERSDQAQSENDASAIGACVFRQLPHDLQLRVLSKLADNLHALQSFCFASRRFAESFR